MKIKHTKGNWIDHKFAKGNIMSEDGRLIANCMGYTTNSDNGEHITESLANAKLIAAAPDLLKALYYLNESMQAIKKHNPDVIIDRDEIRMKWADESINKATDVKTRFQRTKTKIRFLIINN